MSGKYIYESHMGGIYTTDHAIPWEDLYCETCGDSDWEIGFAANKEDAKKVLKAWHWYDSYTKKFWRDFLNENFGEVKK